MIYLRELSRDDGIDVFNMLKGVDSVENSFTNPTYAMTFSMFRKWLIEQESWSRGELLPKGYVAQSTYWLYDDCKPVGIGKIRHALTEASLKSGGNIGYAVSKPYRGNGYGERLLVLLIDEARRLGVKELLLTIDKGNLASQRICKKCGGILIDEDDVRQFYRL